jgi:hypothetical protein
MRALALIVVLGVCHPMAAGAQELLDRTLALVGGQPITLSDARAAIALGLIAADQSPDPVPAVTSRLVDRELILREVQRYAPPEPSEGAVEARLAEVRAAAGGAAGVTRMLDRYGLTEERLRAWIRDDLRSQAYLQQRFAAASTVRDRNELIADWLEELRRRTDVVILPQ